MGAVDPLTVAGAARIAGFTGNNDIIMTAIAGAESSFDNTVTHQNSNGTTDYGLWQINSSHKDILPSNFFPPGNGWMSPTENAQAAKTIYDAQGLNAWSTFQSGAYHSFLPQAQSAASQILTAQGQSILDRNLQTIEFGISSGLNLKGVPGATPNLTIDSNGNISASGSFSNPVTSLLSGLAPMLWIAGGAIIILLGVIIYTKPDINVKDLAALAA